MAQPIEQMLVEVKSGPLDGRKMTLLVMYDRDYKAVEMIPMRYSFRSTPSEDEAHEVRDDDHE